MQNIVLDILREEGAKSLSQLSNDLSRFEIVGGIQSLISNMVKDEQIEFDPDTNTWDLTEWQQDQDIEEGLYRVCSVCGKRFHEGYYLSGEYACSDECRNEWYEDHGETEDPEEEYRRDNEEDDSEYYYSEWV